MPTTQVATPRWFDPATSPQNTTVTYYNGFHGVNTDIVVYKAAKYMSRALQFGEGTDWAVGFYDSTNVQLFDIAYFSKKGEAKEFALKLNDHMRKVDQKYREKSVFYHRKEVIGFLRAGAPAPVKEEVTVGASGPTLQVRSVDRESMWEVIVGSTKEVIKSFSFAGEAMHWALENASKYDNDNNKKEDGDE